jgi:hypothetical protein
VVSDAAPKNWQVGGYIKTVDLQRSQIVHIRMPGKKN